MTKKIRLTKGVIEFKDRFEILIEKTVTKFGTGAKVDCPKEYIGRDVYLIIRNK